MIYEYITRNKTAKISFKRACQAVSVSSSGYFKSLAGSRPRSCSSVSKTLEKDVVRCFYANKGFYGYRKISRSLVKEGYPCSEDQARRVLFQQNLKACKGRFFRPRTTQAGAKPSQRLFKTGETKVTAVNQVWGSDITYLKAEGGNFLYLAVFMDFYSRKIVGWDLSHSLSASLVLSAFNRAAKARLAKTGLMVHSDRGVQYTSEEFRKKLKNRGFVQSMSRKGNCYDNAYCESWFSLLKRELGHRVYSSKDEAKEVIFEWIEGWYNTRRLHSALGYKSPLEFENKMEITP